MLPKKLRRAFPHQYEIVDFSGRYEIRDADVVEFLDTAQVVASLRDCQDDVFDLQTIREAVAEYHLADPLSGWQKSQMLEKFAELVVAGSVALQKTKPETQLVAVAAASADAEDEAATPAQAAEPAPNLTWIEIEVVDEDDAPVARQKFDLELPDGSRRSGRTNAQGLARLDQIPEGSCELTFPRLDETAWEL